MERGDLCVGVGVSGGAWCPAESAQGEGLRQWWLDAVNTLTHGNTADACPAAAVWLLPTVGRRVRLSAARLPTSMRVRLWARAWSAQHAARSPQPCWGLTHASGGGGQGRGGRDAAWLPHHLGVAGM